MIRVDCVTNENDITSNEPYPSLPYAPVLVPDSENIMVALRPFETTYNLGMVIGEPSSS